jgi:hypothetical protein
MVTAVIGFAALLIALALQKRHVWNERITLSIKDKNPYGMYVAYQLLPQVFPKAEIIHNRHSPVTWDFSDAPDKNKAVFIVAKEFNPDEEELKSIIDFVGKGNFVIIVSRFLSEDAGDYFSLSDSKAFFEPEMKDSLGLQLERPFFASAGSYLYPGKSYQNHFSKIDRSRTAVLGKDSDGRINFIQMKKGEGALFLHMAPLGFSNYFLLHKNNIEYYKAVLGIIPANVSTIVWNDFFLYKPKNAQKSQGWFRVLLKYPPLRWGLLTAVGTLLLFILFEARRKQREIPLRENPVNASMDFVKTIGRLYFEKGDHKNLVAKMSAYFLEHLRSNYKIATHTLDEHLARQIHMKTGYPFEDVNRIVRFILFVESAPAVSEAQLTDFHRQLENFYSTTK